MVTGRIGQVRVGPTSTKGRFGAVRVVGTAQIGVRGRLGRVYVNAATPLPQQTLGRLGRVSLSSVTANRAPIVSVNPTTLTVDAGEDFTLTGYDSDVDGTVTTRTWKLNGQVISTSPIVKPRAPVVTADATLTYTYTATDDDGASASASVVVTVLRAPVIVRSGAGVLSGRVFRTFTAAEVTALNPATPASDAFTDAFTDSF